MMKNITQNIMMALCVVILSSCATPAERAAKEKNYRETLARVEADWARMTPEQRRVAKLREIYFQGLALQQMMANDRAERETRALERMAQPKSYWISGGNGNYFVQPWGY